MKVSITVSETPTAAERDAILAPLTAHNTAQIGPTSFKPLAILLKDESGEIIGGLYGRTGFDWLFVELLAIPERLRGQDIGTELMQRAEAFAREQDCVGVRLDTFSFQAPGFYQKLGYEIFGEINDHPRGAQRLFLRKYLPPR